MIAALGLLAAAFVGLLLLVRAGGAVVVLDGVVQAGLGPLRQRPVLLGFDWLTQAGTGGTGAVVLLVASGLLWSSGRGALAAPLWLAFLGAETTSWSVKFLTDRVRPPFLEGLTAASPSFPSAHATVSMTVYGFLALVIAAGAPEEWRGVVYGVGVAVIALISFSRLLLSLHYLSDVIGGALVGLFWLLLAWWWARSSGWL